MSYQLLVIEDAATATDASVRAALAGSVDFSCRQVGWESLVPTSLGRTEVHAVVAVAVPHTPKVTSTFEWLRQHPITIPALAVLPSDAEEPLLRMAAEAADDFIVSPLRVDELRQRLGRILGAPRPDLASTQQRLLEEMGLTQLVGRDPTFLRAIEHVPRFARSNMPVLITGETGTGKELCARAIHHIGARRSCPFIAVDCGAIPDHLFENELFGHARGAFTDAHRNQRGLVAMAEGGTLFLDEIDALSLGAQGKLLRLLQERTFRPLGADRFERAEVTVIAATNRDLEALVRDKQFRSDLYFRLNVLRLHLPPLRQRRSDIALLALHFLREQGETGRAIPKLISPAALRGLTLHDWPGNVRELANVVQRAMVASDGPYLLPRHITLPLRPDACPTGSPFRSARAAAVETFERGYVEDLLRKHHGNVTHAAREAHKDRRAFGRLIKKYRIDRVRP